MRLRIAQGLKALSAELWQTEQYAVLAAVKEVACALWRFWVGTAAPS